MGFKSILCCSANTKSVDPDITNQLHNYNRNRNQIKSNQTSHIARSSSPPKVTDNGKGLSKTESNNLNKDKNRKKEKDTDKESTEKEKESTKMTAYNNSESSQGNDHSSSYTDSYEDASASKLEENEQIKKLNQQNNTTVTSESINNNKAIFTNGSNTKSKNSTYGEDRNEEDDDYDMLGETNTNDRISEKQSINVYSSDRSTGNSSTENIIYQQIEDPHINNQDEIAQQPRLQQTEEDADTPNNIQAEDNIYTDVNNIQNDTDYNMMPAYEESEEYVDLTELQPEQYHADGFSTLLAPRDQKFKNKKCLVLDLDETLVHSSFKYLRSADFVLPVDIDDQIHNVYVIKRPGVDEFLQRVGQLYEVVVFTASVSRYGDPLLDRLDISKSIHHRLFREACYNYEGNYIKNLSQIGRPLSDIIILDNSPASYIFHPQHAIPVSSWFSDTHDNELLDIIPLLEDLAKKNVLDVGKVLDVSI